MIYSVSFVRIKDMEYKDFGSFIRAKREALSIALNKFAIDNGIDPATLSRIETLKQDTKLNVLAKIAAGFNQTASELLKDYENQ